MNGLIIDKIVSSVSQKTVKEKRESLYSYQIIQPHSDTLCVLMPPWHIWGSLWNRVQKRLLKRGYSLLVYEASDDILSDDGKLVAKQFSKINILSWS